MMTIRKGVMGMRKKIKVRSMQLRAADDADGENLHVEGYALVFNQKTLLWESPYSGTKYYEVIAPGAVDANTDKSAITNAGNYAETPGYDAAKEADDNLVKYASGVTKNLEVEASKTTFEQALSSGFWTDIPTASCTTPIYVIAGHEIEWERWCEIVGYIQDVGAYGMWIMLAISVFVMLTGGRQS